MEYDTLKHIGSDIWLQGDFWEASSLGVSPEQRLKG